jgi:hypothetical protein
LRPRYRISTVQTPAASYGLIDIATLKTLLGASGTLNDAYFALASAQASTAAQNFMNNPIVVETIQDQIWPGRDGWPAVVAGRRDVLSLSRWPLVSVASVVETESGTPTLLVAGTDFIADNARGWLLRLDQNGNPKPWNSNPVVAVYSAGYATIPGDVMEAIAEMVKQRWYSQSRDPMAREVNVEGVISTSYWFGQGPGSDTDMPPHIQAKLERYRVPVIG